MTITSKYDINSIVFWMENNKIRKAIVKSIQFPMVQSIDKKGQSKIKGECMYFVSLKTNSSVINWNGGGLYESQIFDSKEKLLKTL